MVPDSTNQSSSRRHLLPKVKVDEDRATLLWRIASVGAAITAGLGVGGAMVREKFYDEMKKTPGFKEVRASSLEKYDALNAVAQTPEMAARDSATKFSWYRTERGKIDKPYRKFFTDEMEKRFGIVGGSVLKEIKGVWQRFLLLGTNNQANALIRGFVVSVATVGIAALLRENNRLWRRLDEMRQQQTQDRSDMRDLVAQVTDTQSRLVVREPGEQERKDPAYANDNPMNDNLPVGHKPKHQISEMQHHERVQEASHHHKA